MAAGNVMLHTMKHSVVHGNKSQCGKGEQQYLEKNSSNLHYYSASLRIIGIFHQTVGSYDCTLLI